MIDGPTVTMGEPIRSRTRATQGSGDPSPTPYDHPLQPNWGLATPDQNLHRKLRSNDTRYKGGLYQQPWQLTSSLPNGTIVSSYNIRERL